jgi:hypothetical protein
MPVAKTTQGLPQKLLMPGLFRVDQMVWPNRILDRPVSRSNHAVVETPRGSTCELDFDSELRAFTLAKPLTAGLAYPYDWGFIPSTKARRRSTRRTGDPRRPDMSRRRPST